MVKRAVVMTTIHAPTAAARAHAGRNDHDLIVVGDRKTPSDWWCDGATFIPLDAQNSVCPVLTEALPVNHYARKMIGYVMAARQGAEVIIDTDDDNHPKANWGFPGFEGTYREINAHGEFVNIYQWFTNEFIWPRGLPLDLIRTSFDLDSRSNVQASKVGVWQGLADGEPDVDAIYRLSLNRTCTFEQRDPVVLAAGTTCPFNSQNTAFRRELFPLLYLPAHVTFRFTDILRGLVAQPIMALCGYHLGFTQATVVQERNPHDLMSDFASEVPMYLHVRDVIEVVSQAVSASHSLETNLHRAYAGLMAAGLVVEDEMRTLEAWLAELPYV